MSQEQWQSYLHAFALAQANALSLTLMLLATDVRDVASAESSEERCFTVKLTDGAKFVVSVTAID